MYFAGRPAQLRLVDRLLTESDVSRHRAGEEKDVLEHQTDRPPQELEVPLAHIHTIDQNRSGVEIIETLEKTRECRLAGTGMPDDRHRLPGRYLERDVVEHLLLLVVAKRDVAELDAPPNFVGTVGIDR